MKFSVFLAALAASAVLWSGPTHLVARPADTAAVEAESAETAAKTNAAVSADSGLASTNASTPALVHRQFILQLGDAELKTNETADFVVLFGGTAKIHGKVNGPVVILGGNVEVDGEANEGVVALGGNLHIGSGAKVGASAVAVGGDLKIDTKATINQDAVSVGGNLTVAEGALIKGGQQSVSLPLFKQFFSYFTQYITQCVFKLRPMAPQVGFVWVIAGVCFLFYLLIAAAFPRPVGKCIEQLDQRALATFLFGILAHMLIPLVSVILVFTGIGLLVVPFLGLAIVLASVVGKVSLLEWIGLRIGQQSGVRLLQRPLMGFVLGSIILTLFYNVWVVGLVAYSVFSVWGMGVGVTALISSLRRRQAAGPAQRPVPPTFLQPPGPGFPSSLPDGAGIAPAPEPPFVPGARVPEAFAFPRAGFWERLAAGCLDALLLLIVTSLIPFHIWFSLVALAYCSALWVWRGTTVGGIVLGLKVVRLDGQPVTFTIALVRALTAGFSIVVLFLGFFWIAWDSEKQAWHDKIAGTVVVRLPKAVPLVCA